MADPLDQDLAPERLDKMKAWCETRIAEKPWFKDKEQFPDKPDCVVSCHFLIALIARLREAEAERDRLKAEVESLNYTIGLNIKERARLRAEKNDG